MYWNLLDLDGGTFSNCVLASAEIRFGDHTAFDDFVSESRFTIDSQASNGFAVAKDFGVLASVGSGNDIIRVTGSSILNPTVNVRLNKRAGANGALGPIARKQTGALTYYLGIHELGAVPQRISLYKVIAGALTLLASTNRTYTNNTWEVGKLTVAGSTITYEVGGTTVTVTDTSIPGAGAVGLYANTQGGLQHFNFFDYCYAETTALTYEAIVTHDLGSSKSLNVLGWEETLLGGGDLTIDVAFRASLSDPITYSVTGLTTPDGSQFTEASGRFITLKLKGTRALVTDDARIKNIFIAKHPAVGAGGGGATKTKLQADYRTAVRALMKGVDQHLTTNGDIDALLPGAVREYSQIKPRQLTKAITGNGTGTYAVPSGYDPEASKIINIEFPVDDVPPSFLFDDEYHTFEKGGNTLGPGTQIQLVEETPEATEIFRVTFTAIHSVSASSTTIEDSDFEGVARLHAAHCAEAIRGKIANTIDSTLGGDSVDHRQQMDHWKSVAEDMRANALMLFGVNLDRESGQIATKPRGRNVDWDSRLQHGGRYLNHRRS